jgi:hypothetical protein
MRTVPIKYVGNCESWEDRIYGSELIYPRYKVVECPAYAAARILRHPEFRDMRPKGERGTPITDREPEPELDENEPPLEGKIPLQNMTLEQLGVFAMKNFGVRFPESATLPQRIEEVRTLVGVRTMRG